MKLRNIVGLVALGAALLPGQLAEPNPQGVTMGHVHLAVRDIDAQKAFWVGILGGKVVKNGPLELIEFPGVYIMLTQSENPPSPNGSVLNHFGFVVRDFPAELAKWKAAHLKIEPTQNPNEVFIYAPDDIRVEVYGVPELPVRGQMNHLHYSVIDIPGMQAWYAKAFGATAGQRNCIACLPKIVKTEIGNLPGMNLSYQANTAQLAGTKGRAIDHVGFEVKNLEAYVKKLEANGIKMDSAVRTIPNSNLKIAFLTDPWGTYIELTEGLAPSR